jgi:hypothetical protein
MVSGAWDMVWIKQVFGLVISFGSEQNQPIIPIRPRGKIKRQGHG